MIAFKKMTESKVSRDPIQGYINIEYQVIWDLINTKEMQRLRRIHQLGGTYQVFASSEHSRFTHSLGTYETARKIADTVTDVKNALNEEDKVVLYCAALLHDIGHGPFSHAFESIHPIHHEEYSVAIIQKDSEVYDVLSKIDPTLPQKVASVIEKTHPNPILPQLVSSQIDADRMDYLLRDAYFSGTPYGYFDIERILRVMKVTNHLITFKASGMSAIENYVMGRYHMYNQVYYHPTSISYEILIVKFIQRIKDLYQQGFAFQELPTYIIPFLQEKQVTNEEHFLLDESSILHYAKTMQKEKDTILQDFGRRILNRDLLKYRVIEKEADVAPILQALKGLGYDPAYYLHVEKPVQSIYKRYGKQDMTAINILTNKGDIQELSDVSLIVRALSQNRFQNKGELTLFYPKEAGPMLPL